MFDNRFSWARGKQVTYAIEVVAPVLETDKEVKQEVSQMIDGDVIVPWVTEESETTKF